MNVGIAEVGGGLEQLVEKGTAGAQAESVT